MSKRYCYIVSKETIDYADMEYKLVRAFITHDRAKSCADTLNKVEIRRAQKEYEDSIHDMGYNKPRIQYTIHTIAVTEE